jgi:hypothetical protein
MTEGIRAESRMRPGSPLPAAPNYAHDASVHFDSWPRFTYSFNAGPRAAWHGHDRSAETLGAAVPSDRRPCSDRYVYLRLTN